MDYKEIYVDFLINEITKKDNLFSGNYTVDPYRNCEFACSYCDSSYEEIVYIKKNSVEILNEELKNIQKGKIILGSVNDPYQKIEKKYCISRDILKVINNNGFSCNILTKSDLVLRDFDLLKKIINCQVTVSISSINPEINSIFEKNVISAAKRFDLVKKLNEKGLSSGIAIVPIMPFINDKEFVETIKSAKVTKSKYLIYKYLELKGDQKQLFLKLLQKHFPALISSYIKLYKDSYKPNQDYIEFINKKIKTILTRYHIENRIKK
jgi:DNA repair photolyase